MNQLAQYDDVAVPSKEIDCRDNELVHPKRVQRNAAAYAALAGRPLRSDAELIEAFYDLGRDMAFAGFKTMFNRHPNLASFVARPDIQFITLRRTDIASTVASFMAAMENGSWRRDGGTPDHRWCFTPNKISAVTANLNYVLRSERVLTQVPNAIALNYEALCAADFRSPELDAFFERHVAIDDPKPPTSGADYVDNWEEFVAFVGARRQQMMVALKQSR
jgi:hypothetical protein